MIKFLKLILSTINFIWVKVNNPFNKSQGLSIFIILLLLLVLVYKQNLLQQ
jgi:hypothetical protein